MDLRVQTRIQIIILVGAGLTWKQTVITSKPEAKRRLTERCVAWQHLELSAVSPSAFLTSSPRWKDPHLKESAGLHPEVGTFWSQRLGQRIILYEGGSCSIPHGIKIRWLIDPGSANSPDEGENSQIQTWKYIFDPRAVRRPFH